MRGSVEWTRISERSTSSLTSWIFTGSGTGSVLHVGQFIPDYVRHIAHVNQVETLTHPPRPAPFSLVCARAHVVRGVMNFNELPGYYHGGMFSWRCPSVRFDVLVRRNSTFPRLVLTEVRRSLQHPGHFSWRRNGLVRKTLIWWKQWR